MLVNILLLSPSEKLLSFVYGKVGTILPNFSAGRRQKYTHAAGCDLRNTARHTSVALAEIVGWYEGIRVNGCVTPNVAAGMHWQYCL